MPLFKDKILSQYIQDEQVIEERYTALQAFQSKAEDIKHFKEEQYQTGFLEDIFEKCLGYTLKIHNPKQYNLEREKKDETDGKKADAVIYNTQGEVIGVIELKDQKTQDLEKVVSQAFHYHRNHEQSKYIIISNFNELRFYIDKQTAYEQFNLFTMNKDEFRRFYLILNYQSIISDLPIEIKQKSDKADADISKKLYADFADFRLALFNNAKQNNVEIPQKKLLHLIQKFCDRIIFILFAEDKGLLKPNTIAEIGQKHTQIKGIAEISLYQIYQKYFQAIDQGNTDLGIMPYNGGLFREDSELNSLTISDDILGEHLPKLSAYDFKSDISVNILGHIFEQSLSDLEELNAAIDNQQFDYNQSKRKKDGIFYTPEYITQFIVEQTIGKICLDKKEALGLNEEIRLPEKIKKKLNKEEQNLLDRLYQYRNFLLELKIIDPACGSGAFLNQALEFLIKEHAFIDKYRRILENESLGLYDIEIAILENNLYGVDINADAVEIAKLSLWLRTAQKGRKLTDLSNNIKCGNSLIDDKSVDENAFIWQNEFPQIMANGGFDIVIGNPPYVRAGRIEQKDLDYYKGNYQVFIPDADLFSYFYEKGINILKNNGLFCFISNTFDKTTAGKVLREFIQNNVNIECYVDFTEVQIFDGATTYPIILLLSKNKKEENVFQYIKIPKQMQGNVVIDKAPNKIVEQKTLDCNNWAFQSAEMSNILMKIRSFKPLKEQYGKCYYGVKTGLNEAFIIDETTRQNILSGCLNKEEKERTANLIKPILRGKDIKCYSYEMEELYIIATFPALNLNIEDYPSLKNYLSQFLPQIKQSGEKGCRKKTANQWFETQDCIAYWEDFEKEKIVWGNLQNSNKFAWDDTGTVISAPACMLSADNKALLAVLNSKIVWLFLTSICVVRNGGYIEVKPQYFEQIPIPQLNNKSTELEKLADKMLSLNAELNDKKSRFMRRLQQNFAHIKIKGGLTQFWQLSFADFVNELKKQKIKLTLALQDEWEDYFTQYQNHCTALQQTISQTDKTIDQMVYQLYGLTDDEIKIVEQA